MIYKTRNEWDGQFVDGLFFYKKTVTREKYFNPLPKLYRTRMGLVFDWGYKQVVFKKAFGVKLGKRG